MFEIVSILIILIVLAVAGLLLVLWLKSLRQIVDASEAHVILGSKAANEGMGIKTRQKEVPRLDPQGNQLKNDKGELLWDTITERMVDQNGQYVWEPIGMLVYCNDANLSPDGKAKGTYWRWPSWLPVIGMTVKVIDLNIRPLKIEDQITFTAANAQIVVDVSSYYRITDIVTAARRIIDMDQFDQDIKDVEIGTIRKTTSTFQVAEIINKRQEISDTLKKEIGDDTRHWGVTFTTVTVKDIKDPIKKGPNGQPMYDASGEPIYESTVVRDITQMKEAEIRMISRKEVAIKNKEADVTEADMRKLAQTAKIESEREIEMRRQEANQQVAEAQKIATEKQLEVERTKKQVQADIDRNVLIVNTDAGKREMIIQAEALREQAVIKADAEAQAAVKRAEGNAAAKIAEQEGIGKAAAKLAEGNKAAQIFEAEGIKQRDILEAEGQAAATTKKAEAEKSKQTLEGEGEAAKVQAVGIAKGAAIKAEKVGEAEGLKQIAEAQTKLQEGAERIRTIEKDEKIGIAQAQALQAADIKIYSSTAAGAIGGFKSILTDPVQAAKAGAAIGNIAEGVNDTSPMTMGAFKKVLSNVAKKVGMDGVDVDELVKDEEKGN